MDYEWRFDLAIRWLPWLLVGVGNTFLLALASMAGGTLIGLLVAIVRVTGPKALGRVASGYTEFFRTTPLLTQLIWVFYALPLLIGLTPTSFVAAWAALSLNMGAFLGELFRAGITSIPRGQWEAAMALGMNRSAVYRRIVLPQATLVIIPGLATYWVSLFKDTSVVSVISVSELMFRGRWAATRTYLFIEMFSMVGIIYVLLTWPQARFADWLYEKLRVK